MTAVRCCVLIGFFALLGVTVVYLRVEQSRSWSNCAVLEGRWTELRRELWRVQAGVARLRSPTRLHDSLDRFRTSLVARGTPCPTISASRTLADEPMD
ncbi:MAG: hypothetical protein AABZ47_16950 [Planctomycetota bacterium]